MPEGQEEHIPEEELVKSGAQDDFYLRESQRVLDEMDRFLEVQPSADQHALELELENREHESAQLVSWQEKLAEAETAGDNYAIDGLRKLVKATERSMKARDRLIETIRKNIEKRESGS